MQTEHFIDKYMKMLTILEDENLADNEDMVNIKEIQPIIKKEEVKEEEVKEDEAKEEEVKEDEAKEEEIKKKELEKIEEEELEEIMEEVREEKVKEEEKADLNEDNLPFNDKKVETQEEFYNEYNKNVIKEENKEKDKKVYTQEEFYNEYNQNALMEENIEKNKKVEVQKDFYNEYNQNVIKEENIEKDKKETLRDKIDIYQNILKDESKEKSKKETLRYNLGDYQNRLKEEKKEKDKKDALKYKLDKLGEHLELIGTSPIQIDKIVIPKEKESFSLISPSNNFNFMLHSKLDFTSKLKKDKKGLFKIKLFQNDEKNLYSNPLLNPLENKTQYEKSNAKKGSIKNDLNAIEYNYKTNRILRSNPIKEKIQDIYYQINKEDNNFHQRNKDSIEFSSTLQPKSKNFYSSESKPLLDFSDAYKILNEKYGINKS